MYHSMGGFPTHIPITSLHRLTPSPHPIASFLIPCINCGSNRNSSGIPYLSMYMRMSRLIAGTDKLTPTVARLSNRRIISA